MQSKTLFKLVFCMYLFTTNLTFASGQDSITIQGKVFESGTQNPLEQVLISISGTQKSVNTDSLGQFSVTTDDANARLIVDLPGYDRKSVFLYGRSQLDIPLVQSQFESPDDIILSPLGESVAKNNISSFRSVTSKNLNKTASASAEYTLQGRIAGLNVIGHSGMPGHRSYLGMRGVTSLYGRNEPTVIIDGMIHEIHYANSSAIDGFLPNPFDIVDMDDIQSISVFRDPQSYLGSRASNGIFVINTEQEKETSTAINIHVYQGITTKPSQQELLDGGQYRFFLKEQLSSQDLLQSEREEMFPWLYGGSETPEYYRYNNNTNWQDEIFRSGYFQKYHIFLKGGDNIATYNISTGYLRHSGIVKKTNYSRYNLRLNGKINITNKLSVIPNAKLSLSDSELMEQGYNEVTNPILVANLKPPVMQPYATEDNSSETTEFLDDTGIFGISNPSAIVKNLDAQNRNYNFLTSAKVEYKFSTKLSVSSTVGLDFNNSRDNVFIPNKGLAMIDSAFNTSRVMIIDYRSFQNHNELTYKDKVNGNGLLTLHAGHRVMKNSYEYDKGTDLNSPTDDFRSLGKGAEDQFLRTSTGNARKMNWIAFYLSAGYQYLDKYYLDLSTSYEGNSALHSNNRYNLFYSIKGAWRVNSGKQSGWLDDMKLRASWGTSGILHNFAYDYSNLYYISRRVEQYGVLSRESIPNKELEMEKKSTANIGLDLSSLDYTLNMNLDMYYSFVNNLIIFQELPPAYGYNQYFDNGGSMYNMGVELTADYRYTAGNRTFMIGGCFSTNQNSVSSLDFIYAENDKDYILFPFEGGELITKVGEPVYSFYGYETNGIFGSDAEAAEFTGPNGKRNKAGDVRYVDRDNNKVINDKDKTIIGNPSPQMFGGLFLSFAPGNNLSFQVDFTYSIGNDVYNHLFDRTHSMDGYYNQHSDITQRWTTSQPGAEIPRVSYGDPTGNTVFSDRWIEKGSYMRVKHFTISYTIPKRSGFYKNIAIYATASNLFTLTGYSGYDPEFMFMNDPVNMGIDYAKIPLSRSFILGIKLDL